MPCQFAVFCLFRSRSVPLDRDIYDHFILTHKAYTVNLRSEPTVACSLDHILRIKLP